MFDYTIDLHRGINQDQSMDADSFITRVLYQMSHSMIQYSHNAGWLTPIFEGADHGSSMQIAG